MHYHLNRALMQMGVPNNFILTAQTVTEVHLSRLRLMYKFALTLRHTYLL